MNCIIISASGEQTFSDSQLNKLRETADIRFYARKDPLDNSEFIRLVQPFNVIGLTRRPVKNIDRTILEQLPDLKALALYSTGYEWVDTEYLQKKGVTVSYLPDYCTLTVAEHTIGMILSVSRRFQLSCDYAHGRIDRSISLRGFELFGKKVGIVGYGKIGMRVAELLKPFGVQTLWFDTIKPVNPAPFYCSFDMLLQESDIIVLTASKERDSVPIIGENEIAVMKRGVVIVNSSRADLVDTAVIAQALQKKIIFSYAVDDIVPQLQDMNIEPGRVFQTAHTAWYSTEAIARGTETWVENIIGLLDNTPINTITHQYA